MGHGRFSGELETNPSISTSRGGEVEDKVAGPYGCFLVAKGLQSKLGLVEEVEASRLSLVKAYGTFVELGLGCSKEVSIFGPGHSRLISLNLSILERT